MSDPTTTTTATPTPTPTETLLAGKYKTTDDLVKGYKELESQLGQRATPTATPTATPPPTPTPTTNFAIDKYEAEFAQTGNISDASYSELEKSGFPRTVVDQYIAGQQARAQQSVNTAAKAAFDAAGGEKQYDEIRLWASTNLQPTEITALNTMLNTGDPATISLAVQGIRQKFDSQFGHEPEKRVGGGQLSAGPQTFRSQAEVTKAMSDPRYKTDPAYRADVEARLKDF